MPRAKKARVAKDVPALGLAAYHREYMRLIGNHEWLSIQMHINGKGEYLSLWLNEVRYV